MMSLRALLVVIVSLAMVSATHFGRWLGIAPDGAPTVAASDLGDSSGSPKINVVAAQDNGNGNGNDNGGDDDDDGGNGNDNGDDDDDNGGDDDDDGDDNDNGDDDDDDGIRAPVGESRTGTTKCFDVQEVGLVQRAIGEGDVTVSVPPDSGFASITRLSLRQVDRAAVPAPPSGSFLDALIWSIDAQSGCAGPPITQLSGGVNLGITYRVPADKSKLQIVYLQGGQWTNVTTFPDPAAGNPYISATINNGGTYAVVQLP